MAPTFRHGKGSFFSLTDNSGTTINFSSGLGECSLSRSLETAEVTTFGDNDKSYIPGLRDATFSVSGHFASTYSQKLDASIGHSTLLSFVFGPGSTASLSPKYTGKAILTSVEYGASVGDKVNLSFALQCSGAITSTKF